MAIIAQGQTTTAAMIALLFFAKFEWAAKILIEKWNGASRKTKLTYTYLIRGEQDRLILVDLDVDIDNILEIDVEFDVWSDFDFGIEYCQANLQMLKLSTNLDMQLLNLEFESWYWQPKA